MVADLELSKATLWPGWFSDQQIAYEQAQHLANALGASVNAGQLAQGWLDAHAPPPEKPRKKKRKHHVLVPGARAVVIPQTPPAPQQGRRRKPPTPQAYLQSAGVTAAILAALTTVLASLWAAAWALGWSSAIALIGRGTIAQDAAELALLLQEGKHRISWMLATRLSRLERVLLAALAGDLSADELAAQIQAILSSLTSALLVTQTETTWASGQAAYHAYQAAGIKYVHWVSRRDSRTCATCLANDYQGPIPLGQPFKSGLKHPPQHPRCRCALAAASAPAKKAA